MRHPLALILCYCAVVPLAAQGPLHYTTTPGKYPTTTVTGDAPRWRLDSIGTLTDSGGVGFQRIMSVVIDPRGGVIVLSEKPVAVTRFSDDGQSSRRLGRVGSGPKEYRDAVGAGWLDGDLALFDYGNSRILRWNAAGDWVAQWPSPHACCGAAMVVQAGPSHIWILNAASHNGQVARGFIRLPATGRGDTIWHAKAPKVESEVDCPVDQAIHFFGIPFAEPAFSVFPTPSGDIVEASGFDYRVAVKHSLTDTVRLLTRIVPAVPITDREWADSTADFRAFRAAHPGVSCKPGMDRPKTKPLLVGMVADERGRVWVERNTAAGPLWEIWDGDRLVGQATGAVWGRYGVIDIRAGRLAVVHPSDDGGVVVTVYRVVEAGKARGT